MEGEIRLAERRHGVSGKTADYTDRKSLHIEADQKVEESIKRINEIKKQAEDYQAMYMNQLLDMKKIVSLSLIWLRNTRLS